VVRVGLTGGIGAGKTVVASMLRDLGARVIEADAIARDLVRPGGGVLEALVEEFGRGILRDDGTLDRRRLAETAFARPGRLERLNAITHPPLVEELLGSMEGAEGGAEVVVVDAALLGDWDILDAFDIVVTVRAPRATRVERLVAGGMSRRDVEARIDAQDSEDEFARQADIVIDNAGSREELSLEVRRLWRRLSDGTEVTDAE